MSKVQFNSETKQDWQNIRRKPALAVLCVPVQIYAGEETTWI
jgi:hypothetical protein